MASAPPYERAVRRGRAFGLALGALTRYRRDDALAGIRLAFPDASPERHRDILRGMYAHFGMNMVDSLRMLDDSMEDIQSRIVWHGREILEREREAGRGVLALTGHIGNWELLAAVLPLYGLPLTSVTKPLKGRILRDHVLAVRTRFGQRVVPAKKSYRDCLRALQRNGVVGFVLDQNMTRREGVFVDFFGRAASTTAGLAHLAARSGASVVPVFMARKDLVRHEIFVLPAMPPPVNTEPETLRVATQVYTRVLEDFIREHPEQWIWIHRRWKTRPVNEPIAIQE